MANFRQYARTLSPTWLRGEWSGRIVSFAAIVFDVIAESVFQAGASNLMKAPSFQADALGRIGSERMMERYFGESEDGYKQRLLGAWRAWSQAGTPASIIEQLAALGLTASVKENWQWNWDGDSANFSRFWVIITGHPWVPRKWGDGSKWGPSSLWGARRTPPSMIDARAIRRVIKKWKAGHTVCPYAVIVFDLAAWAALTPDGTWGDPHARKLAVGDAAIFIRVN